MESKRILILLSMWAIFGLSGCASLVGSSKYDGVTNNASDLIFEKCILRVGIINQAKDFTKVSNFGSELLQENKIDLGDVVGLIKDRGCKSTVIKPLLNGRSSLAVSSKNIFDAIEMSATSYDERDGIYFDYYIVDSPKYDGWLFLPRLVYYTVHLATLGLVPYVSSVDTDIVLKIKSPEEGRSEMVELRNRALVWSWSPFIFSSESVNFGVAQRQAKEKLYIESFVQGVYRNAVKK